MWGLSMGETRVDLKIVKKHTVAGFVGSIVHHISIVGCHTTVIHAAAAAAANLFPVPYHIVATNAIKSEASRQPPLTAVLQSYYAKNAKEHKKICRGLKR